MNNALFCLNLIEKERHFFQVVFSREKSDRSRPAVFLEETNILSTALFLLVLFSISHKLFFETFEMIKVFLKKLLMHKIKKYITRNMFINAQ